MKENKEETKLQSEQKTAEIFFDKVDVSNMLSMVCDQFNASSQGREDFIKKVINDYTTHRIHASQFKSQLPIEQKNELELIIAEKNIDIIHLRDRIKELESQPLLIEGVEREQLREAFEAGQNSDDYDQWVKHNYDFDEWLATRKGSKPDNQENR